MTAAGRIPLRGISALPLGGGMAGGIALLASPAVRALTVEWVASSRRYFDTLERWASTPPGAPGRAEVEAAADAAVRDDEAARQRIVDMRSTEPGALALKAAAVQVHLSRPDRADAEIDRLMQREGPFEEVLALALARDMADVFGPPVQALADAARPRRRT